MEKIKFNLKQKGISLLEVMLSLAIIAIILVMATRYYGIASLSNKLNTGSSQASEIKAGLAQYYTNHGNYNANLADLLNENLITKETGSGQNPFGGTLSLDRNSHVLTISGLPDAQTCINLASRVNGTCVPPSTVQVNVATSQ